MTSGNDGTDDHVDGCPDFAGSSTTYPTPAAQIRSPPDVDNPSAEYTPWNIAANPEQGAQTSLSPGGLSVSQPAEPAATTGSMTAPTSSADRPFVCFHRDCGKSFKRTFDLRRHLKQHEPPTLHCLAQGCRYWGAKGFRRWDKLVSHQQTRHGLGTKDVPWGYVVHRSSEIHRVERGVTTPVMDNRAKIYLKCYMLSGHPNHRSLLVQDYPWLVNPSGGDNPDTSSN